MPSYRPLGSNSNIVEARTTTKQLPVDKRNLIFWRNGSVIDMAIAMEDTPKLWVA
jgi:hypothetical protein